MDMQDKERQQELTEKLAERLAESAGREYGDRRWICIQRK